ncbi:putative Ig domain-containing protein [Nibricoccus aquaticus]|nr:putative Ig domain-containing protein [Nibricoccus aquaticus]
MGSSEAISPAVASTVTTASRAIYRFETPVVPGKPAVIAARFATPSAAEATIRSARLIELVEGSLSSLRQGDTIQLPLPDNRFVTGRINIVQRESGGQVLVGGQLTGDIKGTFSLGEDESRLGGVIFPTEGKVAYEIETGTDGAAYLLEKNKGSVVCMELPVVVVSRAVVRDAQRGAIAESYVVPDSSTLTTSAAASPEYLLSSRPTATVVAYLDFDGETVTDSYWNGGNAINASASGLSASQITEVWQRVSEDYRPFNIDVTTSRSRYDNAPAGSRMRCIVTQTSSWYGSAGGVAYIGSLSASGSSMSSTIPCWVFADMLGVNARYVSEAISHELGHTLGLSHDGLNDSSGNLYQGYYSGHGSGATSWAPIMGSGYYSSVIQWSNGNYSNNGNSGNNTENDLAIISDSRNRAGYMTDDAAATRATASALRFSSGSTVSTVGTIERSGDVDMYSFTTSGGGVTFTLVAEAGSVSAQADLDASATLTDASGNTLATSNPTGSLYPSISTTLAAGTYYLAITGVGEGSVPGTGYTNYGSLGRYEITGSVVSSAAQPPAITSAASASAVISASFSFQVTASNSPTSYSASGLPSGLSINTSSGLISGTVSSSATAGVYSVNLTATNASGSGTQTLSLTLTNPVPAAPSITSGSTGSVVRGNSFSHQIVASNSPTSYGASGLPSGLSINTSTGLISGTVSTSATVAVYSVSLTATNAGGTGTQTFSLTVTAPLPSAPVISSASSGSAVIGSAFSHQVLASNSPTSYAASGLPSGVSINSSSGLISGTVSTSATAGVSSVTLYATNAGGTGTQTFSLTLTNPLPSAPVISGLAAESTLRGTAFSYQITASNSPTSYNATGLPSGLSINTSSGLISGSVSTSVAAGIYPITLTATNAGGSGTRALSLTVTAPIISVPVITSASSARVVLGVAFNFQIVANNSPTVYAAAGLPTGMSINNLTGAISGSVPVTQATGNYVVTVTVTNAGGSSTQQLTLEVKSAYAAWAQDKQIGDINSVSSADPDGDGMGNLLEYAFDLSPSSPDTVAVTQVTVANVSGTKRMEISFIRPANRPDLVYTVEVSANMQTWTAGHAYGTSVSNGSGLPTQEMERTSLGAAGERIRVRDIGGVGQRFIRVKVNSL